MRWRRAVFGTLGILATLAGLALLFVPGFAAGPAAALLDAVEAVGSERVLLAAGLGVIAYLGIGLRTPDADSESDSGTHRFDERATGATETGTTGTQPITASELDEGIQAAIEDGGEPLVVLRERLRTTAVSVHADVIGVPQSDARAAVEGGEWCRDRVATAFLAGPDGPGYSLSATLRLLVVPRRERRRRIERTITAIEGLEYA